MSFPLNVYLLSILAGAISTALALPLWRSWCRHTGLVDQPGHRKIHDEPIPLAGGLAMLCGLITSLGFIGLILKSGLLGPEAIDKIDYGLNRRSIQLAVLFAGAAAMTVLGWLDDKYELRPSCKFAGQLLIAASVAAAGVRITLFVANPVFSYAVTMLWILTVTNAFNFMDNMNGLCAGLAAVAALLLGLSAASHGHYLVAATAFLVLGAALGFLPWNFPKASVFLGDAGSHLLGYLLAVLCILPHFYSHEHPRPAAVLSPLLFLSIPLADLVWVVIARWCRGHPFYQGGTDHLSHRLVRRGLSPARTVLLIWAGALAVGSLAFLL